MSAVIAKRSNGNGAHVPKHILKLLESQEDKVVKVDLGGGPHPQEGFINFDMRDIPGVDIVHDWEEYPWPLPDCSVTLLMAQHVVEHINPARFGFIKWMDEAWRVLKYDGQIMIATPFAGSMGYYSDPTHCNPCTNHTWNYFDPLSPTGLWRIYKPKPWKIQKLFWSTEGNMEVLLSKRRLDKTYE